MGFKLFDLETLWRVSSFLKSDKWLSYRFQAFDLETHQRTSGQVSSVTNLTVHFSLQKTDVKFSANFQAFVKKSLHEKMEHALKCYFENTLRILRSVENK